MKALGHVSTLPALPVTDPVTGVTACFPRHGEIADNAEEEIPQADKVLTNLKPGIVNLITTVYIRSEL